MVPTAKTRADAERAELKQRPRRLKDTMITEQKIIRAKVGLLELAAACKMVGYPMSYQRPLQLTRGWLRLAQKRSIEDTWRYVGDLVSTIQPAECTNYFANAGYGSVNE